MFHRIRASAIVPHGDRVLLVQGYAPESLPSVGGMTGNYWNFPGGGLENDESVLEGTEREVREETGLQIVAERIVYVHEVIHRLNPFGARERPLRQIEMYVLASRFYGEIRIVEEDVLDARFLTREEVAAIDAYPPMLRDLFWQDLADGFPELKFLGTHYVG